MGTSEQARRIVDDEDDDDDDGQGLEVSTPLLIRPSIHRGEISEDRAFVSGELRFWLNGLCIDIPPPLR